MNKEIEILIKKIMAKDIEIAITKKEMEGVIISKEIMLEILEELLDEKRMTEEELINEANRITQHTD